MENVLCKKCGVEKLLNVDNWKPNKSTKSGWQLTQCRECFNSFYRDHYKNNPDKRLEKERRYKANHPDKVAEKDRRKKEKDKLEKRWLNWKRDLEKDRIRDRRRAKTPSRIEYEKKRWALRREKGYNEKEREKYKANPLPKRVKAQRRRVMKINAPGTHTPDQFLDKLNYYGFKCVYCNCELTIKTATEDHRIPLFRGGSDWIANIVPACGSCNSSKGTKTEKEFRRWLFESYSDSLQASTKAESIS